MEAYHNAPQSLDDSNTTPSKVSATPVPRPAQGAQDGSFPHTAANASGGGGGAALARAGAAVVAATGEGAPAEPIGAGGGAGGAPGASANPKPLCCPQQRLGTAPRPNWLGTYGTYLGCAYC